jgi:hypothetical protein
LVALSILLLFPLVLDFDVAKIYFFNISGLQAGIYFVRIVTEKGVVMRKVVKR